MPDAKPVEMLPDTLPHEPFGLFQEWFDRGMAEKPTPNPNAMTIATIDPDGLPSARIVLCKLIHADMGAIVFFTNRQSRKGDALAANPRAAAVFHWDAWERQVRIEGPITHSPDAESDAYFKTRWWMSRLGAWASSQSQPMARRSDFESRIGEAMARFGVDPMAPEGTDFDIPRPPHWGGYRLWAEKMELWLGGSARIHDRARWTRELKRATDADGNEVYESAGPWTSTRLYP